MAIFNSYVKLPEGMCNVASERSQDMYAVLPDIVPAYPLHSLVYWFINVYHVFSFGETSALTKWLFEFTASWSLGSFDQKSRYSSAAGVSHEVQPGVSF